jgi:hypothetical protein
LFESASLRASSNGDDASGAFDLQVRQNAIPTRDGISTYSILDIYAECRLNSSSSLVSSLRSASLHARE